MVGNGTVSELAQRCMKAITDYGIDDWGPKEVDYDGLLKGLDIIGSMNPCSGCMKGGGRTNCEIRDCARGKGLRECADCGKLEECKNSKIIQHMRSGALGVGMKVKEKAGNRSRFLKNWTAEVRTAH